jgi:transglutaminase-like putative cysteine protease
MDAEPRLLQPTPLLDFTHPAIEELVEERGWRQLPPYERIGAVYDFVRNEIACNTKGTLLMALLRAVGIPCRFHGFTIDKPLQKGAITGLAYALAPQRIIHSWVEVSFEGRWVNLEGFILDMPYLASLQRRFPDRKRFCGYGAATPDLSAPGVEWRGQDTYIQKDGIADDFGVFDSPDEFYGRHGSNLSGLKRWLYAHVIRHRMNAQVRRIRAEKW